MFKVILCIQFYRLMQLIFSTSQNRNVASKEETVAAAKCVFRCVIDKQLIIRRYRTYL